MKRKTLSLLSILTISATLLSGCKSTDSVDNSETIETTAIESEATEETETAVSVIASTTTTTSTSGNTTTTNSAESTEEHTSESWPEYAETYDYMVEHTSPSMAHMLNPDVYGTETAGKGTADFPVTLNPETGTYIKTLDLTTTKGYRIEAYWYVEPNTVQFIYTGELSPAGAWFTDPDSMDVLLDYEDARGGDVGGGLNITHEEKIQLLGEPSMTKDEVIAAMKVKYGME